jgi:hypothetical protein
MCQHGTVPVQSPVGARERTIISNNSLSWGGGGEDMLVNDPHAAQLPEIKKE